MITAKIVVIVIMPSAPICTNIMTTICPKVEKLLPISKMESPDTQTDEADINRASIKVSEGIPSTEIGSINKIVPIKMIVP